MVLGVVRTIVKGIIVAKYWLWFVVGKFTDVQLSISQAIGLILFVGTVATVCGFNREILKATAYKAGKETVLGVFIESITESLAWALIMFPCVILIGYIWHQFI